MSVLTEALKEIIGSNGNGNGNSHANGNGKSPSERAWDTAREKARSQGQTVRDDEIRAIKNCGLSVWAKLLFWILSKICWESSGFLNDKRVGSVCITGRQLKKHFSFPQKRLYGQTKKVKDKAGKVLTTRKVKGAIEELVSAGLIWTGKKPITNLPKEKWPNVFNLTALVSRNEHVSLGLLEDVVVVEEPENATATNGGSSVFLPENPNGSGQTPQNALGKHQRGDLAATNGGSGQAPPAGLGKNQRGYWARTNGGSSAATNGGSSAATNGGAGQEPLGERPSPASGAPIKTSDGSKTFNDPSDAVNRLNNRNRLGSGIGVNRRKAEEDFLQRVALILGKNELERNGGIWVSNYRSNPTRANAVMDEVRSMSKEGRIKTSAPKAAMDLWKRWSEPARVR